MCPILSVLQALQSAPEETHGAERAGQRAELCAYRCEDSGRLLAAARWQQAHPCALCEVLVCMSLALCQPLASVLVSTLGEILALRQVGMMPQGQQQAAWLLVCVRDEFG